MRHRQIEILLYAVMAMPACVEASTSWFSCEESQSTAFERHVCTSSDTRKLNDRMDALLGEIEGETAGFNGETGARINPIGRNQAKWSRSVLSKCVSHECIVEAYHARIGFLERQTRRLERGQGLE